MAENSTSRRCRCKTPRRAFARVRVRANPSISDGYVGPGQESVPPPDSFRLFLHARVGDAMTLEINAACPSFDLPGADDKNHSLASFTSDLLVVIVSCNHCPYVIAYEPRIVAL